MLRKLQRVLLSTVTLVMASSVIAEVTLPAIINSQMVLQQGVNAPIWGWADPGEKVTVAFSGQTKSTITASDGKWMLSLDPLEVSAKPQVMTIRGNNNLTLDNILVGEVWLASGQSNMEFSISAIVPEEKAIISKQINNKMLRMFSVAPRIASSLPLKDTAGYWSDGSYFIKQMEAGKIGSYESHSAVAYFFGLKLQQTLHVPVGVIDTSWGGTGIEPWIADEGYEKAGIVYRKLENSQKNEAIAEREQLAQEISLWREAAQIAMQQDRMFSSRLAVPKSPVTNAIYNGMVAPLVPFAIKGTIWYQGESNANSKDYYQNLKALTGGWSQIFNVPDMPFYLVQMAPYDYGHRNPEKIGPQAIYDSVVSAQYKAAKEIKGVDVINIPDTVYGDVRNVHPKHKKTAGDRLAAMALKKDYDKNLVYSGPRFMKATLARNQVTVFFEHIDQGLETSDGAAPNWFEIAGADKVFVNAQAKIDGDHVLVSSPLVKAPQYIRMAWNNIAEQNLRDKNGWPAFSFNEVLSQ